MNKLFSFFANSLKQSLHNSFVTMGDSVVAITISAKDNFSSFKQKEHLICLTCRHATIQKYRLYPNSLAIPFQELH